MHRCARTSFSASSASPPRNASASRTCSVHPRARRSGRGHGGVFQLGLRARDIAYATQHELPGEPNGDAAAVQLAAKVTEVGLVQHVDQPGEADVAALVGKKGVDARAHLVRVGDRRRRGGHQAVTAPDARPGDAVVTDRHVVNGERSGLFRETGRHWFLRGWRACGGGRRRRDRRGGGWG